MSLIWAVNHILVTGTPEDKRKKGPCGWLFLASVYRRIALTGHSRVPVLPRIIWAPLPNWSHFDFRSRTCTIDGLSLLSMAISPQDKQVAGSYAAEEGRRSSPRRKKPKNAVDAMVHKTSFSGLGEDISESCNWDKRVIVMGSRIREVAPLNILVRLMPA